MVVVVVRDGLNRLVFPFSFSASFDRVQQIPMGVQYWKNSKSILPVAEEDGIVGLTFSPSGEHSLTHISSYGSNNGTPVGGNRMQQQRSSVNQMNEFNSNADDRLYQLKGQKESACTASCSSASSNAGDTSSSCGSTAASSVRITPKRRSNTFTLTLPSAHRTGALLRKNMMQTFRNIG